MIPNGTQTLLVVLAVVLASSPAQAQPVSLPLTAAEVVCQEHQLERLAARLRSDDPLHLSPRPEGGFIGLAIRYESFPGNGAPALPERTFAFRIDTNLRPFLNNPQRPAIPSVLLIREEAASTLQGPSEPRRFLVRLDPRQPPVTTDCTGCAEINDRVTAAPPSGLVLSSSAKPGRGLLADGLTSRCTDRLTAADGEALALLQRLLRQTTISATPPSAFETFHGNLLIVRGEAPDSFRTTFGDRVDASSAPRAIAEITLERDPSGRPARLPLAAARARPGDVPGGNGLVTSAPEAGRSG